MGGERVVELKWALELQLAWVQASDLKATVLLPVPIAMLGVLMEALPTLPNLGFTQWGLLTLSVVPLVVALCYLAFSVVPRVKGPDSSLIFFGKIAALDGAGFADAIKERSVSEYEDDLVAQIHVNSVICCKKFGCVTSAMRAMFVAIPPWVASYYVFSGGA